MYCGEAGCLFCFMDDAGDNEDGSDHSLECRTTTNVVWIRLSESANDATLTQAASHKPFYLSTDQIIMVPFLAENRGLRCHSSNKTQPLFLFQNDKHSYILNRTTSLERGHASNFFLKLAQK